MGKVVARPVLVRDRSGKLVSLRPGDAFPDWAEGKVSADAASDEPASAPEVDEGRQARGKRRK